MKLYLVIITIVALGTLANPQEGLKTYSIKRLKENLLMTGKGSDPQWGAADILTDFHYPWEKEDAPLTSFKALHNEEWVYFLFDVKDDDVNIRQKTNDKTEVATSSRAEIFFRKDEELNPYYCLELDPIGRVLDYKATYHRQFDVAWSWPKDGLVIKTDRTNDGYTVEFSISKASLRQLGLLNKDILQAGLFRANCSHANGEETFKWISWMSPKAETPDFHIPSSFGILRLE